MSMNFYEPAAHWSGHLCSAFDQFPHGLVKTPPEVLEQFAKHKAKSPVSYAPDYEKLTLDDWTLAYYFEGIFVAYRSVPEGVEVLAVGGEEVGELERKTPPEELEGVIFTYP